MKNEQSKKGIKVADRFFQTKGNDLNDEVSKGLSTTHEQINEAYNGKPPQDISESKKNK